MMRPWPRQRPGRDSLLTQTGEAARRSRDRPTPSIARGWRLPAVLDSQRPCSTSRSAWSATVAPDTRPSRSARQWSGGRNRGESVPGNPRWRPAAYTRRLAPCLSTQPTPWRHEGKLPADWTQRLPARPAAAPPLRLLVCNPPPCSPGICWPISLTPTAPRPGCRPSWSPLPPKRPARSRRSMCATIRTWKLRICSTSTPNL